MTLTCAEVADWAGWLGGLSGVVGAIVLVRPLFILLRHREAIETVGQAQTMDVISDDLKEELAAAHKALAQTAYRNRHKWKPWAYSGLVALAFGLIAILAQGLLLRCA